MGRGCSDDQAVEEFGAVDEGAGEVGQSAVVGTGVGAQRGESLFHVDVEAFGELALGLFDQDPAAQRGLELFVEEGAEAGGALLQQADGGDVGDTGSARDLL